MQVQPTVRDEFFETADGLRLHYQWHEPATGPRAVLVLLHGYGDHGARYGELGGRLAVHGFALIALDYRGHGQSSGQRGYCNRFTDFVSDLESACDVARTRLPGIPLVLVGHSNGGLIVLRALCDPERGACHAPAILSSPYLRLRKPTSRLKLWLGMATSGVFPRLALGQGIEATELTHDPQVIRASRRDPLAHDRATARWFTESTEAQAYVAERIERLATPTLWLVGSADPVADPEATVSVYHRGVGDKQLRVYDGFYHELFHEVGRERVFRDVETWLSEHF